MTLITSRSLGLLLMHKWMSGLNMVGANKELVQLFLHSNWHDATIVAYCQMLWVKLVKGRQQHCTQCCYSALQPQCSITACVARTAALAIS